MVVEAVVKRLVPDKNVRKLLACYRELEVTRAGRHIRVRHRESGDFIIISVTSSDWRSLRKVKRDLERLRTGAGYRQQALRRT
ncbi:hypothetical protein WK40_12085 [Burkholderia cepacia]|nr:hypothetical protein WK40_12085 [Burkholderia cepacia]KWO64826.1 hypothetical protein WT98_26995 [Burkholderia territorii]